MLVHGAGWWSHTTVATLSHAHALHLAVARVIWHALLMHALHRL